MSRRTLGRRLAAIAAVAALSVGGFHAASASTRGKAGPLTPGTPVTSSVSELYTGVAPCRLVDTRVAGGPLVSVRHFVASGNLSAQGGASNCGIPTNATSLAVNVTAITEADGQGYLRGWPYFGGPVNATLLNYSGDNNMSNMVNLQLCTGINCMFDFDLRNYGSSVHVVVDVIGYYQRPMFASVNANGSRGDSSGSLGSSRPSVGIYHVNFDRDVESCTTTVTDTEPTVSHTFSVGPINGSPHKVLVQVKNLSGALSDSPFYLRVTC